MFYWHCSNRTVKIFNQLNNHVWSPISLFTYYTHSQYGENFVRSAALKAVVAVRPSLILDWSGFPPAIETIAPPAIETIVGGIEQAIAIEVGGGTAARLAGSMNWLSPFNPSMLMEPIDPIDPIDPMEAIEPMEPIEPIELMEPIGGGGSGFITVMAAKGWLGGSGGRGAAMDDTGGGKEAGSRVKVLCNSMLRTEEK